MEPVSAIAVSTIAQLAFHEFIKLGAGELAKQSLGGAINLAVSSREYTNYGRDQINIETIQGNPTIGGS